MTTKAAKEQAEGANNQAGETYRSRSASLADLRHELGTPLNAIIGYSEMLLEDLADAEGSQRSLYPGLENIRSAANKLLALVTEELHPHKASIETEELRDRLRVPTVDLIADCEAYGAQARTLGRVAIIPDLEKIRSASERFLSLIDDAHDLWEIEAGGGEPHLLGEATDASAVVGDDYAGPVEGDGVRVEGDADGHPLLIVDDDEVNRDVLARHLGRQGYATAAAQNGIEALQMLRERKFDLTLLDVMMPEMDGYETLGLMKADPHLRDIPVIMISALDDIQSVVRCIEMGAEDYLPKPFDAVLLRARIGACLEKKRLRDLEVEYLGNVDRVTAAAAAVEAGEFDPATIEGVAGRGDALGQLARVFRRMAREVHAREHDLQRARERLVTTREEERRRLRRDLHDGLGPQLSGQALTIDAIRSLLKRDPAAAEELLVDLEAQTQEAASEIRRLVYALRPPALDSLGLVGALRKSAVQYEQAGTLKVSVEAPEEMPPLPAAVEVACYRIAEEALTNVVRHARARRCSLSIAIDEGVLRLEVCDDGRGLPDSRVGKGRRAGVGLTSMRERATELGGRLVVEGLPEGGTLVRAELPLQEDV